MQTQPPWSQCLHLTAGTCPQLWLEGRMLCGGEGSPRPELSQDLALMNLARECEVCALQPPQDHR